MTEAQIKRIAGEVFSNACLSVVYQTHRNVRRPGEYIQKCCTPGEREALKQFTSKMASEMRGPR